jgi:hypothetical protein
MALLRLFNVGATVPSSLAPVNGRTMRVTKVYDYPARDDWPTQSAGPTDSP